MVDVKGKGDEAVTVEGVTLSHPERLLYPDAGVSKKMLAEHVVRFAEPMLAHAGGRLVSLVRCPGGVTGERFFQKHASAGFPTAIKRVLIQEKDGKGEYMAIEDRAGLVAAVQMDTVEFHVWASHAKSLEKPDRMVFDFDPDEGLGFARVKDAAVEMRERLSAKGLTSFVMASGGKGLHVVVPVKPKAGWDRFKDFAEGLARDMAADSPQRFLAKASKAEREGRIFIDYLRNGRGATAVAPYSPRARDGAPVAWPLAWDDLDGLRSARPATVTTAPGLAADPWKDYFATDQALP